jgi:hypothetical protein
VIRDRGCFAVRLSNSLPCSGLRRGYNQDRSIEHQGKVVIPLSGQIRCVHHHLQWIDLDTGRRPDEFFTPLLSEDEQGVAHANDWANGFMRGMELRGKTGFHS